MVRVMVRLMVRLMVLALRMTAPPLPIDAM